MGCGERFPEAPPGSCAISEGVARPQAGGGITAVHPCLLALVVVQDLPAF